MLDTIPSEVKAFCEEQLGALAQFSPASGGCINHGGILQARHGKAFVKWNSAVQYPRMFEVEAQGLDLLRGPGQLHVPGVIDYFEGQKYSGLLLEAIDEAPRSSNFWENFGGHLARLHNTSSRQFGLDHNNYMGSLNQFNDFEDSLVDFFINCRLSPQINLAKQDGKIDSQGLRLFDELIKKLPDILPEEPPALVHGDLWSGNFMVGADGEAVLIDPAVAYSSREVDLAMSQLFGGFDQTFYHVYKEVHPLEPGYQMRLDIYNLYPLLVHVNLFGGGYYQQVLSILKRYV